jgi:hypothetical protein
MAKNRSETFKFTASFSLTEKLRLEKDIDLRATWTDGEKQLAQIRTQSSNGKGTVPSVSDSTSSFQARQRVFIKAS